MREFSCKTEADKLAALKESFEALASGLHNNPLFHLGTTRQDILNGVRSLCGAASSNDSVLQYLCTDDVELSPAAAPGELGRSQHRGVARAPPG